MTLSEKIAKSLDFMRHGLWRTTSEGLGKGERIGLKVLKTLVLSVRGFSENDIAMRADSLTYSFMFAIVPILSLFLAVARGLGFEQVIESKLLDSFIGQYDPRLVDVIMGFVQRYLETAQGGVFLGVGLLILLWAVYSFFLNIESSFNKIWQVQRNLNSLRKLMSYLMILISIPIVMILSSGVSVFVNTTMAESRLFQEMNAFNEFILRAAPWLIMWLIFAFMYWGIPNTKVGWRAALIPGIIIGTLAQLLQMLGVYIFMFLGRTSIVYGAFAIVPLLLTWVQWLSLLILYGAELSYSIQNKEHFDFQMDIDTMSRRYKDYLTLFICYCIVKRFAEGEPPCSATQLARENNLPVRVVNQLIGRMHEVGILSRIASPEDDERAFYQPALDINKLTVGLLFERVEQGGTELFFQSPSQEMGQFWDEWLQIKRADYDFNSRLVKDILKNEEINDKI